jgi:hypothetical protein
VRTGEPERLRAACAATAEVIQPVAAAPGPIERHVESCIVVAKRIEALPALLRSVLEAGAQLEDVDHGYESLERLYAEIVEGE